MPGTGLRSAARRRGVPVRRPCSRGATVERRPRMRGRAETSATSERRGRMDATRSTRRRKAPRKQQVGRELHKGDARPGAGQSRARWSSCPPSRSALGRHAADTRPRGCGGGALLVPGDRAARDRAKAAAGWRPTHRGVADVWGRRGARGQPCGWPPFANGRWRSRLPSRRPILATDDSAGRRPPLPTTLPPRRDPAPLRPRLP